MHSLGQTSVAALLRYLRYAEHLRLDCDRALAAAGLRSQDLTDTNLRLPGSALENLVATLAETAADPLFGLRAARFIQPGSWSVLGYITMNCATLGEAINRIVPYEKLVGDAGTSRLEPAGDHLRLVWHCRHQAAQVRRHLVENVLAAWLLYARWISDRPYSPRAVWFEHVRPAGAASTDYEDVFGCPVLFGQTCNALLIPWEYLDLPLRQADPALLRTLEEHALAQLATLSDSEPLPLRVKHALRRLLGHSLPRKEEVAARLGLSVRTLQRRLQQAGTGYQEILDQLRRELAEDYLLRSELSLQEIAERLGFSEARSFHRSFKGWTGMAPGEYRRRRYSA